MPVHNEDIAAVFEEIADLLEIEADNPFRIRAYRNGARTLRELGRDVRTLIERGEDITRLSGIGKNLADKIHEILDTSHCRTPGTTGPAGYPLPAGARGRCADQHKF